MKHPKDRGERLRRRNAQHQALRSGLFRQRVVKDKRKLVEERVLSDVEEDYYASDEVREQCE